MNKEKCIHCRKTIELTEKAICGNELVTLDEHRGNVDATHFGLSDAREAVHVLLVALLEVPAVARVPRVAQPYAQAVAVCEAES